MITTLYHKIQGERSGPRYAYFDERIDPNDLDRHAEIAAWMGLGPTGLSVVEKYHLARAYAARIKARVREHMPGWTRFYASDPTVPRALVLSFTDKVIAKMTKDNGVPVPDDMLFDESNLEGLASLAAFMQIGPTCLSPTDKAALAQAYHRRVALDVNARTPAWTKRYPYARPRQPPRRFLAQGEGAVIVSQLAHVNPMVARGMFQAAMEHVSPIIQETLELGWLDCRNNRLSKETVDRVAVPNTIIYDHQPTEDDLEASMTTLLERACGVDPEPKWIGVRDLVFFNVHENEYGTRYYSAIVYMTPAYSTTRQEWIESQIERNRL